MKESLSLAAMKQAKKNNISGVVDVYFMVPVDGSIKKSKISKNIGYECDVEAIRVVNLLPKRKSAMKSRAPMEFNSHVTIPFEKQE
jgi:periplasmic protein TonB